VVYKEGQKIIATENLYAQCDISLSGVKKNVPTRFKENLELILKKFLEK